MRPAYAMPLDRESFDMIFTKQCCVTRRRTRNRPRHLQVGGTMMRPFVLSVGLVACASGAPLNQTSVPTYAAQLRLYDTSTDMPARRLRLELPTAREMAHSNRRLVSRVELCVTPDGETETVKLRGSSG